MNVLKNQKKSNNVVFLRHGKIDLQYPSHDAMPFDLLNRLAKQELDPASDKHYFIKHLQHFKDLSNQFNFTHIFCSPSPRCVSLLSFISALPQYFNIKTTITSYLNEVRFDLEKFSNNKTVNLPAIKSEMIERLLSHGVGVESLSNIIDRIQKFINILPTDNEDILILTHGYFMMIIATLLLGGGIISKETLISVPRFQYFEGFVLKKNATLDYITVRPRLGASSGTRNM